MITINNDIGSELRLIIQYDGCKIGECTNLLSFFDVLCQVKSECCPKYSAVAIVTLPNGDIKKTNFKILPDGRLSPIAHPNVRLWNDILETQILYLNGFKPDFIYKKQ